MPAVAQTSMLHRTTTMAFIIYTVVTILLYSLILNFDFINWTSKTEVYRVPRRIVCSYKFGANFYYFMNTSKPTSTIYFFCKRFVCYILLWQFWNSVAQIMCNELLFLNKIIQYFWFGKNNAYPATRLAQLFCQKMMYLGVRQVFLGRVVLKLLQVYVPRACVQLWEAEIQVL